MNKCVSVASLGFSLLGDPGGKEDIPPVHHLLKLPAKLLFPVTSLV